MKTKKTKKADLENKKTTFFLIGLVIALSLVLVSFEWKTSKNKEAFDFGPLDPGETDWVFIPPTNMQKAKPPKPIIKIPDFIVVDNDILVEDPDLIFDEPDDPIDFNITDLVFNPSENKHEQEEILDFADVMPEFPGGTKALIHYLSNNVNYPLIAQENGIKGKVFVSFIVDEQGNIFDVKIVRGVDSSLDNEALRVVKNMPKWMPGMQNGKPVKVRYNVPINFQLN